MNTKSRTEVEWEWTDQRNKKWNKIEDRSPNKSRSKIKWIENQDDNRNEYKWNIKPYKIL